MKYLLILFLFCFQANFCEGREYGDCSHGSGVYQAATNWCVFAAMEFTYGGSQFEYVSQLVSIHKGENRYGSLDYCRQVDYNNDAKRECITELVVYPQDFMEMIAPYTTQHASSLVYSGYYSWADNIFPKIGLINSDHSYAISLKGVDVYTQGYTEIFDLFYMDPWYGQVMYYHQDMYDTYLNMLVFW